MPKGENSKKAAGNAKKAEAAASKKAAEDAKAAVAEDKQWGKGAKDNSKAYVMPAKHLQDCCILTPASQRGRRRKGCRGRTQKG
jgi:hypothetical protein